MEKIRTWARRGKTARRERAPIRAAALLLSIALAGPSFAHGPKNGSAGRSQHAEARERMIAARKKLRKKP